MHTEYSDKGFTKLRKVIAQYWIFLLIYVIFFVVAVMAPPGGDDFAQAMWYRKTIPSLVNFFSVSNSFYGRIGSFMADAFFGYYRIIWIFFSPLIYVLILTYLCRILNCKSSKMSQLVFLVMLMCFSKGARAQTQFWETGNVNYNLGILLIIIFFWWIVSDIENKTITFFESIYLDAVVYFVFGFLVSTWIENLSLSLMVFVIGSFIIARTKQKKLSLSVMIGNLGVVIGTIFLFSSGSIKTRVNTSETMLQQIEKNLPIVAYQLVGACMLLYMIGSAVMLYVIYKKKLIIKSFVLRTIYIVCNIAVIVVGCVYYVGKELSYFFPGCRAVYIFFSNSTMGVHVFIQLLVVVLLLVPVIKSEIRPILLMLYISAFVSVGPMVLSPGERNLIYAQYIVIAIMMYWIGNVIIERKDEKKLLFCMLAILLILRIDDYLFHLLPAYKITQQRENIIEQYYVNRGLRDDNLTIILPLYDEENFVETLNSLYYADSIIARYKLNSDTNIIFDDKFLMGKIDISYIDEENVLEANLLQYAADDFTYRYILYNSGQAVDIIDSKELGKVVFDMSAYGSGIYSVECYVTDMETGQVRSAFSKSIILDR